MRSRMRTGRQAARRDGAPNPFAGRAMTLLRRAYFANAADPARRYAISFDAVLEHLWRARRHSGPIVIRAVRHVDDLVQVIACTRGCAQAWADLVEQHEAALVRVCRRRLDEMDAVVHVRRLFAELQVEESTPMVPLRPTFHAYCGVQPLRSWLADHAIAAMGRFACAVDRTGRARPIHRPVQRRWPASEDHPLRLAGALQRTDSMFDGDPDDTLAADDAARSPRRDASEG